MTQDKKTLLLGGGLIRAHGRHVGQITGAYVERSVDKVRHDTNFGLEYKTDHVIAIKTGYNLGWTFQEVQPGAMNLLLGSPGYGAVPWDRSLPGERRSPRLLSYSASRRLHTEHPRMLLDDDDIGVWYPLTYPIAMANVNAEVPFRIQMDNTSIAGGVVGYRAFIVIHAEAAGANPSICSNIEFVPYSTYLSENMQLTMYHDGVMNAADTYSIYAADVTRHANGEFEFTSSFCELVAFQDQVVAGLQADGRTYVIAANGVAIPLMVSSAVATSGCSPWTPPINISQYGTWNGAEVTTQFPQDWIFEDSYEGSGKIKLSYNSGLTDGEVLKAVYWYDVADVRELPLAPSGANPIIELDLEILFPDMESKMLWHFYRAQINSGTRFSPNEADWTGMDFVAETLDASDRYPRYGFGYMQLIGPICAEILEWGNFPFGIEKTLASNQNSFA